MEVDHMKNSNVTDLWIEYKENLSDVLQKKLTRIEQSINEFENQGYQLETMSRQEAKILSEILSKEISYASTKNYCCMINKFLRLYEEKYGVSCEKCYALKYKSNENIYYSEDELIDDIESHIDNLVNETLSQRNVSDNNIQQIRDSFLSAACLLMLRWYGMTLEEIRYLKKTDIIGNKIILPDREKSINNRALEYIERYKNKTEITHFWRYPTTHNLPDTPYLFRRESVKKTDDMNDPMSLNLLAVMQHRFMKGSNIKKQIVLSGAFSTIPERTSEPVNLLERVHEYLGDEIISDINIKKGWIGYLEGLE